MLMLFQDFMDCARIFGLSFKNEQNKKETRKDKKWKKDQEGKMKESIRKEK